MGPILLGSDSVGGLLTQFFFGPDERDHLGVLVIRVQEA